MTRIEVECYFKLRGDDGATYIVRYDNERDAWELTSFTRP
jgi:hypothetical protein